MGFKTYFWFRTDYLNLGIEESFKLYSIGHLIWLAGIIIAAGLISQLYKNYSYRAQKKFKKWWAIALLVMEIYKDLILVATGHFTAEFLPFHLCGLALFVILIDAFTKKSRLAGQMLALGFLPGAWAALLFCNWTEYPFTNFMNIHSFLYHGWIVVYVIAIYRNGEVRITYKGLWKTIGIITAIVPFMFMFNQAFDTNFMFLNEASSGSPTVPLWNMFYESYGYLGYVVSLWTLAFVIFHVVWLIYFMLGRSLLRGGSHEKETKNLFGA